MKTHRYLYILWLIAVMPLCFSACSSDDEPEPERAQIPYLKIMESPGEWQNAVFDIDCNEQTITITCYTNISNPRINIENYPWIIMEDKQVKEDPKSETLQYQTYTFRIGANEGIEPRIGLILIYGASCEIVEVHQAAPVSP